PCWSCASLARFRPRYRIPYHLGGLFLSGLRHPPAGLGGTLADVRGLLPNGLAGRPRPAGGTRGVIVHPLIAWPLTRPPLVLPADYRVGGYAGKTGHQSGSIRWPPAGSTRQ